MPNSGVGARIWFGFACLLAISLCAEISFAATFEETTFEGRRITDIRIVDEHGANVTVKSLALKVAVGKPFDFGEERESLRTLYRTGDFADIRVAASPEGDGVRVDFIVRRNFYNNVVRIDGLKEPPTDPAALAALRLNLGEPFRESALREAISRLQDLLRTDGLYLAKITWDLGPHDDTRQMDITVHVDPGIRSLVGNITVKNRNALPGCGTYQAIEDHGAKTRSHPRRLTRGSQRIKKYLVNQGYLGAGVVITPGAYDPAANRTPLTIDVTAGPRVRVELTGSRISKGRLRKLLPIYAEGAVDEDLLQEGRRNIRDFFQREGYFDADVKVTSREDAQTKDRVISYEISRGDKFRLAAVSFDGNKYFSRELLYGRLQLQTASFASSGRFSQSLVRADIDSIKGLYLSNGFRDAQVTSTVDDNYHGKKGNLFVAFHIEEGPQTLVSGLEVQGNHALSTEKILAVTGSTPGQPFSEAAVASDRNNILAMYYNEGYPEAHFEDQVVPGSDPEHVKLVYHISEGTQIEVSKVLLTGYQYTRPGIVARQVKIVPGPLREGEVVETQRRLYNLGVFSRVTIAPQNPNGTDPQKVVVVDAEEGKRYTFAYGGGFEVQRLASTSSPNGTIVGASPRGILELSRANMFGRAETLSFKVRVSTLQYRAVVSYTADNLFADRKLSLQLTGFADKTQDINTFTSIRYEGAVQLVQTVSQRTNFAYRYFFRRVNASNLKIEEEEIPLLSQPTLVSGFGVTWARDRRDNAADAKRGSFNTIDASIALKSLGSAASFFRGSFQNSTFTTFGRAFVFARSVRFGVEQTFRGTGEVDIPLPERFFAGGGTSIRGFSLNQAGPRDPVTGFPIGGLALLAFNQELRFPMRLPFVGNKLGGTVFYDAGNVYTDINHISFAWKPPANNNNLPYFSHTIGVGVRYPTPVGPVRVDFGYQLNPPHYAGEDFPSTGPPIPKEFALPHFQFFFNIGPVF